MVCGSFYIRGVPKFRVVYDSKLYIEKALSSILFLYFFFLNQT